MTLITKVILFAREYHFQAFLEANNPSLECANEPTYHILDRHVVDTSGLECVRVQ